MRQRQDGVWYYEVNNIQPILDNVIPFFRRFHFLSAKKKRDFAKFVELAELFKSREAFMPRRNRGDSVGSEAT